MWAVMQEITLDLHLKLHPRTHIFFSTVKTLGAGYYQRDYMCLPPLEFRSGVSTPQIWKFLMNEDLLLSNKNENCPREMFVAQTWYDTTNNDYLKLGGLWS